MGQLPRAVLCRICGRGTAPDDVSPHPVTVTIDGGCYRSIRIRPMCQACYNDGPKAVQPRDLMALLCNALSQ